MTSASGDHSEVSAVNTDRKMSSRGNGSHIPRLQRSASVKIKKATEEPKKELKGDLKRSQSFSSSINRCRDPESDDDASSVKSFGSCNSFASCDLSSNHNGDRRSSNCKKYILHCQRPVAPVDEKYLTPTQRKDKQIRQLKAALVRATRGCEEKGVEVERLLAEVERLRYSHSCQSGSQVSESPLTVLKEDPSQGEETDHKPIEALLQNENKVQNNSSLEDSGILSDLLEQLDRRPRHFKDLSSDDSKDICSRETQTYSDYVSKSSSSSFNSKFLPSFNFKLDQQNGNSSAASIPDSYWPVFEDVKRCHTAECQQLKEMHNNKVENLLQKLSELNSRYFEVRSAYEKSLERCRVLDNQVAELKKEMAAQEEWHSQMYLKMYRKGQEAAKFEHADEVLEFAHKAPKRVSVPELLQQLHRTEHELEEVKELYRCELYRCRGTSHNQPLNGQFTVDRQAEYTLKFLKDAFYYYLTEKDNRGHLKAIESILGFSDKERLSISKAVRQKNRLM